MDKMEKLQNDRDFALELAKKFHCERFLTDHVPSQDEQIVRLRSFFFERIKQSIASKLSVLEAYYVASNNLDDEDDCVFLLDQFSKFDHALDLIVNEYKESLCVEDEEEVLEEPGC